MTNSSRSHPNEWPLVQPAGNPSSDRTVFYPPPPHEPRRTKRPSPTNRGTSGPSKRRVVAKPIDLTEDDMEFALHSSVVPDDPDDPINLGATESSRSRIIDDIRVSQSLKARHRGGESSNAPDMDMKTRVIEELPVSTEEPVMGKGGVARGMVPSPGSEEWGTLRATITALREENEKLKLETRDMAEKLYTAEASQEAFRFQVTYLKGVNTTQQDDINSLRAELVGVREQHDRFIAGLNAERAALEVQQGELKDVIVEQQVKISKLERQGFKNPSNHSATSAA